jgi:predicted nuclease of predicted toxin-antitoxin system
MLEAIRFHLDEHVHPAIAEGLRRRGIDVTTTIEAGLLGAGDEKHLEFCGVEGRVVVTNDADFLRLHTQGVSHQGIVYFHTEGRSIGDILRGLILIHECLRSNEMIDHLEFL